MQQLTDKKQRKKVCYWCNSIFAQNSIQLFDSKFMHPHCYQEIQNYQRRLDK